jgi:glycosyltransferase involved in cell wall biosynthesis
MRILYRLARIFWRMLPPARRRSLFIILTTLASPRSSGSRARVPVVVAGMVSSATGLGESARMNIEGLKLAKLPYAVIDLSGSMLGPADLPSFLADQQERDAPIGQGSLILHVPAPVLPYAQLRCGRGVVKGKNVVGFIHWELPRVPAAWRSGLRFMHEVWVPSQFCAAAVRPAFDGPIRVIPHPVDVAGVRKGKRGAVFTVLTMFNVASSFERKNPLAAIRAFKAAFGSDRGARLVMKVHSIEQYPDGLAQLQTEIDGADNITLLTEVMARRDVLELIAGADVALSLHRSEGFGLLAAEAMMIGVPVVATDWSATAEFVTPETGVPIGYSLIPAIDPQGACHDPTQMWADADVDAAAAALRKLRADPAFWMDLSERARSSAGALFSAERYAKAIRSILTGPPTSLQ